MYEKPMLVVCKRVQFRGLALASCLPVSVAPKLKTPMVNKWILCGHLMSERITMVTNDNEIHQK